MRTFVEGQGPQPTVVLDRNRGKFVITGAFGEFVQSPAFQGGSSGAKWVGYVFPGGHAGTVPYSRLMDVMSRLQREAAEGLAEKRPPDPESWRRLFNELGLQKEFSIRAPRDKDPYLLLREIVAARSGRGTIVFFLEDFRPPTSR